ncbi:hypothetical protein NC796_00165 [Aliifodinibius sp. S!AR15-10]|uniref:hypothetical protein n=1 Tax=Aliifodinibius sp. S!AR15-10 TaxID=2950437 RepID=UPI00285A6C43|nr:hypothetical protein [Aliifodinibius sp. S!AR15-10]MDR8389526.1 hypothetical protein [Aliifodinibius sp. S!AR15-10]
MLEAYADSVGSREEGAYLSLISWNNLGSRSWKDVESSFLGFHLIRFVSGFGLYQL